MRVIRSMTTAYLQPKRDSLASYRGQRRQRPWLLGKGFCYGWPALGERLGRVGAAFLGDKSKRYRSRFSIPALFSFLSFGSVVIRDY